MKVIDKYRLPQDIRQKILRKISNDNMNRWWDSYQVYLMQKQNFAKELELWMLNIQALGTIHKDSWPSMPQIPCYPYEAMKVDKTELRSMVLEKLKSSSAAGQLIEDHNRRSQQLSQLADAQALLKEKKSHH